MVSVVTFGCSRRVRDQGTSLLAHERLGTSDDNRARREICLTLHITVI